jgi:lysophospholipase L1-like esterase
VINRARGGRSSRTYISEGLWEEALKTLNKGDFVLIQFGHNDSSPINDTARARGTIKGIGNNSVEIDNLLNGKHETVYSFGWYLRRYVADIKAKGATPVLVSPIPRNNVKNGKIIRNSDNYGGWTRQVSESERVPFIDLNEMSASALDKILAKKGQSEIDTVYYKGDHTHTSLKGARLNAKKVVEAIRHLDNCNLKDYLSNTWIDSEELDWESVSRESKPYVRWWWLGSAVDSINLRYNLEALSDAGIGGVEITPIYGVKGGDAKNINYLSPKWMTMLSFTESEAKRLNMEVDMNNGTGWPFGGPNVTAEDAATKAIFKPTFEIGKTRQMVKRAAPGGQGLVIDHLDKNAVNHYLARFDSAFSANSTPYPDCFFNDSYEVYGADWTPTLFDEFEKRRGYRLQEHIDDLLADGATDTSARVIADYRETISDLLRDNFTKVWTEWAHSHGAKVRNQAHGSPANLLDLYSLVDIPECETFGITDFDIPGLRKDSIFKKNDGDPTVLKYASSAAHITGKPYISAEALTWLTEHFRTSLSQCKPEIDLMFSSGVNHLFFHGAAYSPKDAPWPGWKFYASIDMSPTNSIWRDAPALFRYIAQTQAFLQSGNPDSDFLLYLPIYDIWHNVRGNHYLPFSIHDMRKRIPEFCDAVERIMASGYDLDYISDRFIATCSVENGKIVSEGGTAYKAIIFPSAKILPLETAKKLLELAKQGAKIVFIGDIPSDVPGLNRLTERRSEMKKIMQTLSKSADNESSVFINPEVFVKDFGGKLIRRKHDSGYLYFLAMLKNNPVDGWMPLSINAESAIFFDPMTGEKGKAKIRNPKGKTEIYLQMKPGQSIIIKTFTNKNIAAEDWKYYQPTGKTIALKNEWILSFSESEPSVSQIFKLKNPVSWTELPNDTLTRNMGAGRYSTYFNLKKRAESEYRLSLGDVRESARVFVNGRLAATLFAAPFEVNIGKYLEDGRNLLEIEITNLPANRIADYDRRGIEWRIFNEINVVNINYKTDKYSDWGIIPSGLLGPVIIEELKKVV